MSLKSNYRDGDTYTKKSKKEGYRSRASYKLKEILEKDISPPNNLFLLVLAII